MAANNNGLLHYKLNVMHLSWRQLEAFRLFARTMNVSEAARLLHVSQPAVSQLLKELEEQLGFELFHRARGRAHLSAEAHALLPEVDRLFGQMAALKGRAAELRDTKSGSLSVASVPTVFAELLPTALSSFRSEYPNVNLKVATFTAGQVAQQVRYDTADVGIAFMPFDEIGVTVVPLMTMHVVCVMTPAHRLAKKHKFITLKDLEGELLIVQGPQSPPGLILRESLGASPNAIRVLETNQSTAALQMARHGLGVALVHPLTLSLESKNTEVAIPFRPVIELTLGMIYSKQRAVSRAVMHFEQHLQDSVRAFAKRAKSRGLHCEALDV